MLKVKIKKGHHFLINGNPEPTLIALPDPGRVALLPARIAHIKPRLKVVKGDQVAIGAPLVEDKRNTAFQLLSPGGGTVSDIQLGPRRRVDAVVIDLDNGNEARRDFPVVAPLELDAMDREKLATHILNGGLWWVFQELPFRDLPDPGTPPPQIIVSLSSKEPFQPLATVYLKGQESVWDYGLRVLQKLSAGPVLVFGDSADSELIDQYGPWLTHGVQGRYPADDPAVLNFRLKQSTAENRAWIINGQDVLLLARLLSKGRYPTERVISVGGGEAARRNHFQTRLGAPLANLAQPISPEKSVRWVVGGLMRGYSSASDGYLGLRETSLTLLPEGDQARFLALFDPGFHAPTYSRVFLSRLNPNPPVYDCNLHGETRACIACMFCVDVCPVDIMPQMTYKAILAEEVEEYLQHGLLDCVECGLCSYVCPSKIELSRTFQAAKAAYAKELTGTQPK